MTDQALGMLRSLLGPDGLIERPEDLAYYATDISGEASVKPLCVIRPSDVDQLCQAVTIASGFGLALVPRGAGFSYTGGYLPERAETVMVDLTALDRVVEINEDDMYVTVEAGCTWKTLYDALTEKGLRTLSFGPLSGFSSTVGGAVSNDGGFFGGGSVADSILGLDVVLADGSLLETGSSAADGRTPFLRAFGPDLTGLFIGDCGAFGIKARVTLRLIHNPTFEDYLSFAFERVEDIAAIHAALARENVCAEQWGIDPVGNEHLAAKGFDFLGGLGLLRDVAEAAGGAEGLRDAGKVLIDGHRAVTRGGYSLHVTVEGASDKEVQLKADRVRRLCVPAALKELPNAIPKVTRAKPFRPIKALLGPQGENWLPVHGLFPLSRAEEIVAITDEYFFRHRDIMTKHGIAVSYLTSASATGFLIEPMFYWSDRLHAFHLRHVADEQKKAYGKTKANPAAREAVMKLRRDLAGLWDAFGASHHQLGRHYAYANQLSSAARAAVIAVKSALDPKGVMNPGVLELSGEGAGVKKQSKFPEFPQDLLKDMRNVI